MHCAPQVTRYPSTYNAHVVYTCAYACARVCPWLCEDVLTQFGIARSEVSDLKLQLQESKSAYDELARQHHEAVSRADTEASGKDKMLQQVRKYQQLASVPFS